ncbi:hypothetical protein OSB04_015263 [Centaurea solstitialis]|uniref:Uncharacterized protein n=1 Tax=Centaurea solstitialis TaxID=347529 RepID=A0AA38SYV2_9ASTR|nr:hypothetical protein OSB04_015263 [Centaurea solstitialis]
MMIVWDFDRTIMDDDSDRWVVVEMAYVLVIFPSHFISKLVLNVADNVIIGLEGLGKNIS